jgi:hypothetical protein
MHRIARLITPAALALLAALPGIASAQWAWKDNAGKMVYSDRAPPGDIKPENILHSPAGSGAQSAVPGPASTAPVSVVPSANDPKDAARSTLELDAAFKKRQTDKAAADAKAADVAQAAQVKSGNCARSKASLQQLQDGLRMRAADGGIMGDDERAAETARISKDVSANC